MDKLFLDANVLFSAAYSPNAGLRKFWQLSNVKLLTSAYAVEEAQRNLTIKQQIELKNLLKKVKVLNVSPIDHLIKDALDLPDKDKLILLAAIAVQATHLITGDFRHFSPYYDKTVEGVLIFTPAYYLKNKS